MPVECPVLHALGALETRFPALGASQLPLQPEQPPERTIPCRVALALIAKPPCRAGSEAVAAGRQVELADADSMIGANHPPSLPAVVRDGETKAHSLSHLLPILAAAARIGQFQPFRARFVQRGLAANAEVAPSRIITYFCKAL